jgi:hypothetical protein
MADHRAQASHLAVLADVDSDGDLGIQRHHSDVRRRTGNARRSGYSESI